MDMLEGVRVTKDDRLTLLARPIPIGRETLLSVRIIAGFGFDDPTGLMDESRFWALSVAAMGKDRGLDYGFPKRFGEFSLAGNCYVENGRPEPAGRTEVRIGPYSKDLVVFGRRRWRKTGLLNFGITAPEPFTVMPLIWENAFGGPDYVENPLGKGLLHKKSTTGELHLELPNIEDPRHLIGSPEDRPTPAGYFIRGLSWRKGFAQLGTFDDLWLKNFWPGLPPDIDRRFFNRAPVDQWAKTFFRGDEPIQIWHMHPEMPYIETRLPKLRARCLARYTDGEGPRDHELHMRLETVWLFPHLEAGGVIWAGEVPVEHPEAVRFTMLAAGMEPLDEEPRPVEEIIRLLTPIEEPPEEPEPPAPPEEAEAGGEPEPEPPMDPAIKAALDQAQARVDQARAELESRLGALGIAAPPDFMAPPPVEPQAVPLDAAALEQRIADLQANLQESLARLGLDINAEPPVVAAPAVRPLSEILADFEALGLKDNAFLTAMNILMREADEARAALTGKEPPEAEPEAPAEEAPLPEPAEGPMTREGALARIAAGESLAGRDLTGIDLSGADLHGADLSSCLLERANCAGADLSRAVLRESILTGANLTGARLAGADLTRASAFEIAAPGADFTDAVLIEADLAKADLSRSILARADLTRAEFTEAGLNRVNAVDCRAPHAVFNGVDAGEADFSRADLSGSDWSGAALTGAGFHRAVLHDARLTEAHGERVVFTGADLTGVKADGPAALPGADFTESDLTGCYWQEANLEGAHFLKATLNAAGFIRCNLNRADFRCCRAREAMFRESTLDRADCSDADFFIASFRETVMTETDLSRSNLYSSDLAGVTYRNTVIADAILTRTLLINPVLGKVKE